MTMQNADKKKEADSVGAPPQPSPSQQHLRLQSIQIVCEFPEFRNTAVLFTRSHNNRHNLVRLW